MRALKSTRGTRILQGLGSRGTGAAPASVSVASPLPSWEWPLAAWSDVCLTLVSHPRNLGDSTPWDDGSLPPGRAPLA